MHSTTDLRPLSRKVWTDENGHFSTFYTLVETRNYRLDIEETPLGSGDKALSIHFEVWSWTPRVLREMLRDWPAVRAQIDAPLLACAENQGPKWEKFISKFGFHYLMDVTGIDGEQKRLFVNLNK